MESITRIIKRDGRTAEFDVEKITEAIYKAVGHALKVAVKKTGSDEVLSTKGSL